MKTIKLLAICLIVAFGICACEKDKEDVNSETQEKVDDAQRQKKLNELLGTYNGTRAMTIYGSSADDILGGDSNVKCSIYITKNTTLKSSLYWDIELIDIEDNSTKIKATIYTKDFIEREYEEGLDYYTGDYIIKVDPSWVSADFDVKHMILSFEKQSDDSWELFCSINGERERTLKNIRVLNYWAYKF